MKTGYWLLLESSEWLLSLITNWSFKTTHLHLPMKSHIFFFLQQITCCYLVYRHATQPVRSYFPNQGLNTPNQGFNCGALAMRARSPNHWSIREFLAVAFKNQFESLISPAPSFPTVLEQSINQSSCPAVSLFLSSPKAADCTSPTQLSTCWCFLLQLWTKIKVQNQCFHS